MDYNDPKTLLKDLKDECKKLGLPVSGTRAQIVARLNEHAGQDEVPAPKAAAKNAKATGKGKRAREDDDEPSKNAAAQPAKKAKVTIKVDSAVSFPGASVVDDWAVMLNQTDIKDNHNKFYVIQVIKAGSTFYCHTRWGRVSEPGQSKTLPCASQAEAEKEFVKKFKDKTKNDWSSVRANSANFKTVPGLYTLVELDHSSKVDEAEIEAALSNVKSKAKAAVTAAAAKVAPSKLPAETQELVRLIFDADMFADQLSQFEIDVKQLPLGKLNVSQIKKGFDVLERLKGALSGKGKGAEVEALSNEFYSLIPHSFKRQRPPPINNNELLQSKLDMLNVLNDIEIAQTLTADKEAKKSKKKVEEAELPNPLDENYALLGAEVKPLSKKDAMYARIETYFNNTKSSYGKVELQGIFEVTRKGEDARFAKHDKLDNRRLLWHGTNIAVVVAILNTGLRIMPHSGGRVGRGIYFASESGKSAGYVARNQKGDGFMFLNEVALGKEHHITVDDSSLKAPPKGFDCVIAQGQTEPDTRDAETVKLDGKDVRLGMGKPVKRAEYKDSHFTQSEYLVYQESQVRIRYLLKLKYPSGGSW